MLEHRFFTAGHSLELPESNSLTDGVTVKILILQDLFQSQAHKDSFNFGLRKIKESIIQVF